MSENPKKAVKAEEALKAVLVCQEGFGLVTRDGPVTHIGTFGCGPCIGCIFKHKSVIGCFHISSAKFVLRTNTLLYIMLDIIERVSEDNKLDVYLVGGQNNIELKHAILDNLSRFKKFEFMIIQDDACQINHVSSVFSGFDIEHVQRYYPSGSENPNINHSINMLFDPNPSLVFCYRPDYPNDRYVVKITVGLIKKT